jgi:4-hydroxy-tetrahydrodipicolinate synthase
MSEPFHGVLPALITPFTEDGAAIDTDSLAAIVERLIGAGSAASSPAGAPASSRRSATPSGAS